MLHKHEVYLIETQKQRGKNMKVIKRYIQSTLSNIIKTRSEKGRKQIGGQNIFSHIKLENTKFLHVNNM